MTYAEAVERLSNVDAAIERITGTSASAGAQEYSIGNRSLVRPDLKALFEERSRLTLIKSRLDPSASGGAIKYPVFGPRR